MDPTTAIAVGALLAGVAVWIWRTFTGFPAQGANDYHDMFPVLDLPRHLNGRIICDGLIFGPSGRVTSRFEAVIDTRWDGPNGIMDEHFRYDDKSTQQRQWRLTLEEDGAVRAEADDVPGTGRGRISGNALGLRYRIKLPAENGGYVLDAVDWIYLSPNGTFLNRSQFRKFGVKVAELFCTMRPEKPEENDDA